MAKSLQAEVDKLYRRIFPEIKGGQAKAVRDWVEWGYGIEKIAERVGITVPPTTKAERVAGAKALVAYGYTLKGAATVQRFFKPILERLQKNHQNN